MELSNRISGITGDGSDGWGVFYRARQLKAEGNPVIELTIGEHDIRTHPDILREMDRAAMSGHTGYAMVPGTKALREAVAKRISERTGLETSFKNIMVTPGGQAALFSSHLAVCDPGDTALYIDPYYATYPTTLRSLGTNPVAIKAKPENQFQPDAADIERVASGAKSLLVNSPNNPTGVVYSKQTLTEIAEICVKHDLWLISDEVYDTQVWEGEHVSPRALPNMKERTLVVGSMSKSHAMTGSRVGWICAPEPVVEKMIDLATNTTYGVPGFIQDAATFALGQGTEPEETVAEPFRRRRSLSLDLLAGQNLVKAVPAQGAMYVMLDIRATGLSGEDFANALLDAEMIAVMPGESFGQAAAGHIRIAMTIDDEAYIDALNRVIEFAHSCCV